MEAIRKPKDHLNCVRCGNKIPEKRRSDAKYCTQSCRAAAEKKRYKAIHPDYVERQKKLSNEWRHLKEHGHTDFLSRPELNPKDKFALARSLGYRSMLEYTVAQQLIKAGVPFEYEKLKITYFKSDDDIFDEEEQPDDSEKRWW
jgi:predicted nucleic acid-binding Zn ribbon protein